MWRRPRQPRDEQRALALPDLPGPSGYPASQPTPQTATSIADAFACIRVLADAALSIPLTPYRRTPDGAVRAGDDTRIARLLRRPATGQTLSALIGTTMAHLNLWGNAYVGKYREAGEIIALGAIRPDQIVPELDNGEPIYSYYPLFGDPPQRLTVRDIIHIHSISVDGLEGISPVRSARRALTISDSLAAHAETFFDNDARPSGILRLARFGNVDTQVEALRTAFESQHKGNPHRIAVVAGDVQFEPLSMPLDDAQFLEQRKLSAVEVARIFRVPARMIDADPGSSLTYANREAQALDFVTYGLRPWLTAIEQAFTQDQDLCFGNLFVSFELDTLLAGDHAARASYYSAALNPATGWMTRAEVRERENLPPEQKPPDTLPSMPFPAFVPQNGSVESGSAAGDTAAALQ